MDHLVARADPVHRVVVMGSGDVGVHGGVFGATFARSTPALVSRVGARLVVTTRARAVACNDLLVGGLGGKSVHLAASNLKTTTLFVAGALGRGRVRVDTSSFGSNVTLGAALGDGAATQLTARHGFHSARLMAHQRGAAQVRVAARSGVVDLVDVPSYATKVHFSRPRSCVVRVQAPQSDWRNNSLFAVAVSQRRDGHAVIQHVGARPTTFADSLPSVTFEQLKATTDKAPVHEAIRVPAIADAVERPMALGSVEEGWLRGVLAPTRRSLLPIDV